MLRCVVRHLWILHRYVLRAILHGTIYGISDRRDDNLRPFVRKMYSSAIDDKIFTAVKMDGTRLDYHEHVTAIARYGKSHGGSSIHTRVRAPKFFREASRGFRFVRDRIATKLRDTDIRACQLVNLTWLPDVAKLTLSCARDLASRAASVRERISRECLNQSRAHRKFAMLQG